MSVIKVLIADDHPLVRESVKAIISNENDMEVIATAGDGKEAIELSETYHPDVVVMDISMGQIDGIHATRLMIEKDTEARIVILSMHVNATLVQQAIRLGAQGYVLKRQATDELPQAIRTAFNGEVFISSAIPPNYLSF